MWTDDYADFLKKTNNEFYSILNECVVNKVSFKLFLQKISDKFQLSGKESFFFYFRFLFDVINYAYKHLGIPLEDDFLLNYVKKLITIENELVEDTNSLIGRLIGDCAWFMFSFDLDLRDDRIKLLEQELGKPRNVAYRLRNKNKKNDGWHYYI